MQQLIAWIRRCFDPAYIEKQSIKSGIEHAAQLYASGLLLDVGCGNKPYKNIFVSKVNSYVGVDVADSPHRKVTPEVYGYALNLPFKNASFDTVLCTQVLDDLPEPGLAIKEMSRVLKKGGYLILTAPQSWGIHDAPHDYYRFTKFGLAYLIQCADLSMVECEVRGGFWAMVGQHMSSHFFYKFGRYSFLKVIIVPLCAILQRIALLLDRLDYSDNYTLGYTLVAKKL